MRPYARTAGRFHVSAPLSSVSRPPSATWFSSRVHRFGGDRWSRPSISYSPCCRVLLLVHVATRMLAHDAENSPHEAASVTREQIMTSEETTTSANERRAAARHRVLQNGLIAFNGLNSTFSCSIRNKSDSGALLLLPSTLGIPDRFRLIERPTNSSRECEVVRRSADALAVRFVG